MSGPYCKTCKYFRRLPLNSAECGDPAKIIYFAKSGVDVTTPPTVTESMTCCRHTQESDEPDFTPIIEEHKDRIRAGMEAHEHTKGSTMTFKQALADKDAEIERLKKGVLSTGLRAKSGNEICVGDMVNLWNSKYQVIYRGGDFYTLSYCDQGVYIYKALIPELAKELEIVREK